MAHVALQFVACIATVLPLVLTSCSGTDSSDTPETEEPFPAFNGDCTTVKSVPTFGQLEQGILTVCRGCHSAQVVGTARHDAPPGIDFDTYDFFSAISDNAVLMVQNSFMPPPNGAVPSDSQKNQLYAWAACGKPR